MKVKDIIKKQTTIIAIAVVLVAITVIGVSYAIFFDVKKNTNNQVIKAGTLQLTVSDVNALQLSDPMLESAGLKSSPVSYTVKNTGNLPANYDIYIFADTNNTMDLSKIKISLDGNASSGNTAKVLTSITDTISEGGKTYYKINAGNIAAGANGTTNYVRVWIDEESLPDEVDAKVVSLNMYIISEVQE